jgi:hypothetical protein
MLHISPQNLSGSTEQKIADLSRELNTIQREVNGMGRQTLRDANGREWAVLASPKGKRRVVSAHNPFDVTLGEEDGNYYVKVRLGYVIERAVAVGLDGEALFYHECSNRLDSEKKRRKFTIRVGEAIFVSVSEDKNGRVIGNAVELAVYSKDKLSTNFIPEKQPGAYFYKLAELIEEDDETKLRFYAGGSNIYHSTGLTCDTRIMACATYPYSFPPAQLSRISFVSGRVVALDQTVEERPLSANVSDAHVEHCT